MALGSCQVCIDYYADYKNNTLPLLVRISSSVTNIKESTSSILSPLCYARDVRILGINIIRGVVNTGLNIAKRFAVRFNPFVAETLANNNNVEQSLARNFDNIQTRRLIIDFPHLRQTDPLVFVQVDRLQANRTDHGGTEKEPLEALGFAAGLKGNEIVTVHDDTKLPDTFVAFVEGDDDLDNIQRLFESVSQLAVGTIFDQIRLARPARIFALFPVTGKSRQATTRVAPRSQSSRVPRVGRNGDSSDLAGVLQGFPGEYIPSVISSRRGREKNVTACIRNH